MINTLISLIKTQNYFSLKSQGTSMLPMLQPDDVLYFIKTNFANIRVNDFILISRHAKTFTHRVIFKNQNYLVTKGDNNLTSDGKIYPKQVIGKVYQVKRGNNKINPENIYLIQSSLYFAEIVKIKKVLEKEKVDFVFLKGLPLHLYFEKSHPRRIYADCDILVPIKNSEVLDKIFSKFQYKKANTSLSKIHRDLKNKVTEVSYIKILNNFPVIFDVHFEISFLINQFGKLEELYPESLVQKLSNHFLSSKREIKVQKEIFPILSAENLILYLSIHFFHHNFRGEYRLGFLDKIIRHSGERMRLQNRFWSSQNDIIKRYHLQNFVFPVFVLLMKYYSTPIPSNFLKQIKTQIDKTGYIQKNILAVNIFDGETRISAGITRFKNLFYLSPNPWWKKVLVIFNPAVIYSIFWVIAKKVKSN